MSNIPPLFSIIVPVYNTADYIESCLRTLLDQICGDLEIIAVDDGSTDDSLRIIQAIARRDPRLRVFSKENGGQGSARNVGLTEARGSYVGFVDSDDTVHPELLARVAPYFSDPTIDVVSFGIEFRDDTGRRTASRGPTRTFRSAGDEIFLDAMLDRHFLSSVCNKIYRRTLLNDNNIVFPELRAYEDSVFSRRVAQHAREVVYLAPRMYFALTRAGSTSRGMTARSFVRAADMLAHERDLFLKEPAALGLQIAFRAHVARFLAYLLVLSAFRIDSPNERATCRKIADEAGFQDCSRDRSALALLDIKARAQVFLARHPTLLRVMAVTARRLGRVPY